MTINRVVAVAALLAFVGGGCSARQSAGWEAVDGAGPPRAEARPEPGAPRTSAARVGQRPDPMADSPAVDLARLRRVYDDRSRSGGGWDYPIGTGDVIEISVPGMPELEMETVRVSSAGTVALPMLQEVRAAGLTEHQFKDELHRALSRYMYKPQVSVHVKEYRSRQVGVLGAVESPGLHTVQGARATILDMISEAGGLTDDSTQRLLFIPAQHIDADGPALGGLVNRDVSSPQFGKLEADPLLQASDPIVIDLEKMNRQSAKFALSVPVRPGDTIMALGGGQVFVQGWVEEPGAQKMVRGLTLLGAIAAAGGTSYPAEKSTVQILREQSGSERVVKVVDLRDVEEGRAEDIRLREGDLVVVEADGAKLVGYGVYQFFSNVMRVGVSLANPF